jgi:hypothetical protein
MRELERAGPSGARLERRARDTLALRGIELAAGLLAPTLGERGGVRRGCAGVGGHGRGGGSMCAVLHRGFGHYRQYRDPAVVAPGQSEG